MRRIDLHAHSSVSDGTLSPAEVVREARRVGLAALALTDHDTLAGLPEAQAAGAQAGVEIVAGVELSVAVDREDVHLLGLGVQAGAAALEAAMRVGQESRDKRNPAVVAALRRLGIEIGMAEVEARARSRGVPAASVGRPHIAEVLVAKGVVATIQEAFDRYLAQGKPAFVERRRVPGAQGVAAVQAAGGVAVLAHPVTLRDPEGVLRRLAAAGLDGVEVVHSQHGPAERARFSALARELGLAPSGGSDFHGANKPEVALGTGRGGNVEVPYAWLEGLRARQRR